ncbi:zeaxanthin epoxidase [Carex littledalei]|uniref:Zeaxanthin epoxidase n=1 Tax=Carex littledalei TaxID=544730 RepID=A0A833VIR7_9POAL|nr:zeaxanthin epoxidase [Carex littledalei]
MEPVEDIVIVGAGLAGLATALGLHRRGVKSLVLESSPAMRSSGFALGMWTNAWRALDALGVGGKACGVIIIVRCHFSRIETKGCSRQNVLVGCDGIYSVVAKYLGLKDPDFSGRLSARGFADYPTNHGVKPEHLLITGGGFRAGMLPTSERSMYWFFTWRPSKKDKIDQNTTKMREFIIEKLTTSKAPNEIIEVIKKSEMNKVLSSHLRYRSPFSLLNGSITKRNICVIGDALHPMTPDLGQGGCMALEDGVILARYLSDAVYTGNIEKGMEKFAKDRRWRCAEVVTRAYVVGFIQQSSNCFVSFLREKVLAKIMAKALLKTPDYDCGKLRNL